MKIAIYNKLTGEIDRFIFCLPAEVMLQCRSYEEFYLNCAETATHIINNAPVSIAPPAATTEQLLQRLRIERNSIIAACDWTQVPDVPLTAERKSAWAIYRQELRDFPETCDPTNPIWPTPPN